MAGQIAAARSSGDGDLNALAALLAGNDTWDVG